MQIKQNFVRSEKYNIKCPYLMVPEYITFHNTDNSASAKDEINYMISNDKEVSFHVAVDDIEAIQGIPFDRNTWNAGDGNGNGNRKSISVEICYNALGKDNPKFKKAEANAVEVCAQLLKQFNLGVDKLKPHKHWSGKNCPSTTDHQDFINRVNREINKSSDGWAKYSDGWSYKKNGKWLYNCWRKISNIWYYFNNKGYAVIGWKKNNNKWYYFNQDCKMQTGWIKDNDKWYYLNSDGSMAIGWLEDNGKKYYLNESGAMENNHVDISGKRYSFAKSGELIKAINL